MTPMTPKTTTMSMNAADTSRATATRHPAWVFLGASATTVLVTAVAADWLQASLLPALGVPARLTFVAVALLSLLCTGALAGLGLSRRRRLSAPRSMPCTEAARQVREVVPCLKQMNDLLSNALKDSEHSAQSMIERMGSILTLFVETQEAEAQANLDRVKRLQSVKDLTTMVDEISNVARQTNFLSINAAIEAARAGESGRSFAVLAAEIRQLSQQTTKVAVDITAKIESVTMGIDQELGAAVDGAGSRNDTRNMRQVVADIAAMQARFVKSMDDLQINQVSEAILNGHRDLAAQLAEALGQVQSQDVMRQRIEGVQRSLDDLNELLQGMADQLHDRPWAPDTLAALRERLQTQVRSESAPPADRNAGAGQVDNRTIELF